MDQSTVQETFENIGGRFITDADKIAAGLKNIRALVFDWDGVFNAAFKGEGQPSTFNEADSMGTNMLRYGMHRAGAGAPICAIISGENNQTALKFAERESFNAVYLGIGDKRLAAKHLAENHGLTLEQIAFVFDDVNDLGLAGLCGLRFMIHRNAGPLLHDFAVRNGLCDYITGNGSQAYAVREICELNLGLLDEFDATISSRINVDDEYRAYFTERQKASPKFYKQAGDAIAARES